MIIELMGHQNVGKEFNSVFLGEVQMSRIAHKFDLSHHKLASLHFQRQSILFWTINLYAVLFFPRFTVSFNILFKNSIYLIFCVANLPDTRHVYLSVKKCYLSIS